VPFTIKKVKNSKNLTLIELLILVIILAILSAIAVPSYLSIKDRAKEAGTESQMRNIVTAIEIYKMDKDVYPPTSSGDELAVHLSEYMDDAPSVDLWLTDYAFINLENNGYTLTSAGRSKDIRLTADNIVFTNGKMTSEGSYPHRQ
jgi:type II secretory pathway pseudopilin PulG